MSPLAVAHHDGVPVVTLPPDVDAANVARVRDELATVASNEAFDLIVDASGTRYIDSAGIDMLFRLARALKQRRATLRVVIPPESQLLRLAGIVGLEQAMPLYEMVAAALAEANPVERREVNGEPR